MMCKTCFDGPFHGKTFAPHLYLVEGDRLNYIGHDGTKTWPPED